MLKLFKHKSPSRIPSIPVPSKVLGRVIIEPVKEVIVAFVKDGELAIEQVFHLSSETL